MASSVIEKLSRYYADEIISHLGSIRDKYACDPAGVPDEIYEPLLGSTYFHPQNIGGHAYNGLNKLYLSLVASSRGWRIPVWMTFDQMLDYGLTVGKGSHTVPVLFTTARLRDTQTGEIRTDWTIEEYDRMTPDERMDRNLKKTVLFRYYSVFNIEQTNFGEIYPDAMEEMRSVFNVSVSRCESPLLDDMVASGSWICPVHVSADTVTSGYDKERDAIFIHPKERYVSESAYYSELLRGMARSTGSEMNLDRDIWSELAVDRIHESLVTEICAASVGSVLGLDSVMTIRSLDTIDRWMEVVDRDPSLVYDAMCLARDAAEYTGSVLGIGSPAEVDIRDIIERHAPGLTSTAGENREVRQSFREERIREKKEKEKEKEREKKKKKPWRKASSAGASASRSKNR